MKTGIRENCRLQLKEEKQTLSSLSCTSDFGYVVELYNIKSTKPENINSLLQKCREFGPIVSHMVILISLYLLRVNLMEP